MPLIVPEMETIRRLSSAAKRCSIRVTAEDVHGSLPYFSSRMARLGQEAGKRSVRANPATSAPSHICETWRNVAQTCLIIKEMGPERSRINVSDPI